MDIEEEGTVATGVVRDEGSVVIMVGQQVEYDPESMTMKVYGVTFAADHRMAQAIVEVIEEEGQCPIDGLESWQILSKRLITDWEPSNG